MKERLLEFLRKENKSSAQLQRKLVSRHPGISHILSGRNNPSLDFVLRMLDKYPFISTEWLLFGKGSMYREARMQSLFDFSESEKPKSQVNVRLMTQLNKSLVFRMLRKVKRQDESPLSERNRYNQK